jgi:hypothetical protein
MSAPTMRLPFGKFRGMLLTDVPDDYLAWLHALPDLREPLRGAVHEEFWRRSRDRLRLRAAPAPDTVDELVGAGLRSLARRHHPDVGGDAERMKDLNHAADWVRAQVRGGR